MQMAVGDGALPPPVPVGAGDRASPSLSCLDREADAVTVVGNAA